MKKIIALLATLFLLVFAWMPSAVANENDPALAVAEAAIIGISKVSEAYAAAQADETMTVKELSAKAVTLKEESELYEATAKMLKTMDETPTMKYLGEERRLSGTYHVTEYKYPARDVRRYAVLAIKSAVANAELKFVNLRLARLSMETCVTGELPCNARTASARALHESAEAKDAYTEALNTIRFAVP